MVFCVLKCAEFHTTIFHHFLLHGYAHFSALSLSSTLLTSAMTRVLQPLFLRCVTATAQNRSIEYLHFFACVCMSPAVYILLGCGQWIEPRLYCKMHFLGWPRVYSFREKSFWGIQGAIGSSGPCKYSFLRVCSAITCLSRGCAPR